MSYLPPLFAYFGPEASLPLTTIVATVLGIAMTVGRLSLRRLKAGVQSVMKGR